MRSKEDSIRLESLGVSVAEKDREILLRLGKKPVLKRNFGFMSIFGFASTIMITWETVLIALSYGLTNGGSAGLVYEYIYIWIGITLSFTIISELASMAPVSGGQYHWVSMLAPTRVHSFVSYVTGWLTICGWQGSVAAALYYASTMLTGLVVVARPSYTPETWHQLLIAIGMALLSVLINARGGVLLPRFEGLMLMLHILGFFAILIPLVVISPHQSAEEVFTTFSNYGNQPTQGVSFLVGTLGHLLGFCGADGAIHMAEEIENAAIVVPIAIVGSYVFNGILGFAMLIAIVFCTQSIPDALSSPTNYPFMQILLTGTGSAAGASVMIAILVVLDFCAVVSVMASASRQLWSFARDHGVPGWQKISKVETRTSVPLYAVLLTATVSVLLQLINLGSSTALEDMVSITVAGLYSSYLIAASLLLYRRCTGRVSQHVEVLHHGSEPESTSSLDTPVTVKKRTLTNTANAPLTWGPWHVPGVWGAALNALVCAFLTVSWFWTFWPAQLPIDYENMNYNCVLWGGVVVLSVIYYVVKGRKEYKGPIIEVDDD